MAKADYRCCDLCDDKVFYDSNLNYQQGPSEYDPDRPPFRTAGEEEAFSTPELQHKYGTRLDFLGDWAVLCTDCAKTHRTVIVPIAGAKGAA